MTSPDLETFDANESNASLSIPVQASSLRENGHLLIKDHPCVIKKMSTSKNGKHGGAKIHFVGIDMLNDSKHEMICGSTDMVQQPVVTRSEYTFIDMDETDGFLTLLDVNNSLRYDIAIPKSDPLYSVFLNEKEGDVETSLFVTVTQTMGSERIVSVQRQSLRNL